MKKTFYIALSVILIIGINSCKKEGCTDQNASNYNYLAKKEDGTCVYGGLNGKLKPMELSCYTNSSSLYLKNDPNREVDYLITCYMSIGDPITIEAGVVIEFTENAGISFTNDVTAVGTSTAPIIFKLAPNQASDWGGVSLNSGTGTVQDFKYVTIDNATSHYNIGGANSGSSVYINGPGTTTFDNCTISNGDFFGMEISTYQNSSIQVSNTTFSNCQSAIILSAKNLLNISNLTLTNNTNNYIDIYANYYGSLIIPNLSHPYRVAYGYSSNDYFLANYSSSTMTINQGVSIYFAPNFELYIPGTLNANGTVTNSIKFLGTSSVSGSWKGVSLLSSGNKSLNYVEIGYAGQSGSNGALYLANGGNASITNCNIHDSGSCGIYNQGTFLVSTGTTFTNVTQNICP